MLIHGKRWWLRITTDLHEFNFLPALAVVLLGPLSMVTLRFAMLTFAVGKNGGLNNE